MGKVPAKAFFNLGRLGQIKKWLGSGVLPLRKLLSPSLFPEYLKISGQIDL
jgi:hypothetical protein